MSMVNQQVENANVQMEAMKIHILTDWWKILLPVNRDKTDNNIRAPLANLGFWDYIPFEFGITEIRFEFGIMGLHPHLKLFI